MRYSKSNPNLEAMQNSPLEPRALSKYVASVLSAYCPEYTWDNQLGSSVNEDNHDGRVSTVGIEEKRS